PAFFISSLIVFASLRFSYAAFSFFFDCADIIRPPTASAGPATTPPSTSVPPATPYPPAESAPPPNQAKVAFEAAAPLKPLIAAPVDAVPKAIVPVYAP